MADQPNLDGEALAAHASFVRSLARRLIRDEHEAEDLAQETVLRTLEKGPERAEALPAWMTAVGRNLTFKGLRTASRRRAREEDTARRESLEGAGEQYHRENALQGVVKAVMSLPEHYRQVILLRFFEDLPPRKIAKRTGENIETVRTRLNRAKALLKEKLDKEWGDRDKWIQGLVVLVGRREAVAPLPALLPGILAWLAILITAFTGARFLWPSESQPGVPASPEVAATASGDETVKAAADERDLRSAITEAEQALEASGETPSESGVLVIVVDLDNLPVAGATVFGEWGKAGWAERGTTGEDGRVRLRVPRARVEETRSGPPLQFAARASGHGPSAVGTYRADQKRLRLRLRGSAADLQGLVVDGDGRPVAGARVHVGRSQRLGLGDFGRLETTPGAGTGRFFPGQRFDDHTPIFQYDNKVRGFLGGCLLGRDGEFGRLPPPLVLETGATGEFHGYGIEEGVSDLFVEAAGFASRALTWNPADGTCRVTLEQESVVQGIVVGASRGCTVYALGDGVSRSVPTDASGNFRLGGLRAGDYQLFADSSSGFASEHRHVDGLVTWEPQLQAGVGVSGTLRDPQGQPLGNHRVMLRLDRVSTRPSEEVKTDKDGRFELRPFPDEPAHLFVYSPQSKAWILTRAVSSGEELGDLTVDARFGTLSGRAVDALGNDLAPGTRLIAKRDGGSQAVTIRVGAGGRFLSGPLPLGTWRLLVPCAWHLYPHPEPAQLSGGDFEFGEVRPAGLGTLELDGKGTETWLELTAVPQEGRRVPLFAGRVAVPAKLPLAEGAWEIRVGEGDPQWLNVTSGTLETLTLPD